MPQWTPLWNSKTNPLFFFMFFVATLSPCKVRIKYLLAKNIFWKTHKGLFYWFCMFLWPHPGPYRDRNLPGAPKQNLRPPPHWGAIFLHKKPIPVPDPTNKISWLLKFSQKEFFVGRIRDFLFAALSPDLNFTDLLEKSGTIFWHNVKILQKISDRK